MKNRPKDRHAALGFALVLTVLVFPLRLAAKGQPDQSSKPEKLIEIDGSKTPDRIPDYLAWESSFRFLSGLHTETKPPLTGINIEVALPREEMVLIEKTARLEAERQGTCTSALLNRNQALKKEGVTEAFAKNEARRDILACREASLSASERLLAALSPSSAAYLRRWVSESKRGMVSYVSESDLDFFWRPR